MLGARAASGAGTPAALREGGALNRIVVLAAACAAAVFLGVVGIARADAPAHACGVSESCIAFKTRVVGGPASYLNFRLTVCAGQPGCAVPDIQTSYTNGEADTDSNLYPDTTYYLTAGQSSAADPARLSDYTSRIACSPVGPGATAQALATGYGQLALTIPPTGATLISCTITNTY